MKDEVIKVSKDILIFDTSRHQLEIDGKDEKYHHSGIRVLAMCNI